MPLIFNGLTKTITWSGGPLSVRELWSRYVDWLTEADNSKYGTMLYTVGMDTIDIPLYVFLDVGVTILVTNNTVVTSISDGILKTPDDHDPFGGAVVNVRYDSPGIAIGYNSTGAAGPTATNIAAAVRAAISEELARLDAAISTRQPSGIADVNVGYINGIPLKGDGTPGNPWDRV